MLKRKFLDFINVDRNYQLNENDEKIMYILFLFMIFLYIFLPFAFSIVIGTINIIYLGIATLLVHKYADEQEFIFLLIFPFIMMLFISLSLVNYLTPYRGNNEMVIRRTKIKKLKRKSFYNKIKFWEK